MMEAGKMKNKKLLPSIIGTILGSLFNYFVLGVAIHTVVIIAMVAYIIGYVYFMTKVLNEFDDDKRS